LSLSNKAQAINSLLARTSHNGQARYKSKTREQNAGTIVLLNYYGTKGFPLIAGDLESPEQHLQNDSIDPSIGIQTSRLLPEFACSEFELHGRE